MAKINKILRVENRHTQVGNKPYKVTVAQMEDGSEATGYGDDFKAGDRVELFFHRNQIKIKKTLQHDGYDVDLKHD